MTDKRRRRRRRFKDRIKEFRRVAASELHPHPHNWRMHPTAQRDALSGVLAEVGIADAVLARELPDGSLQLVDGHLRADLVGGDTLLPVLILDLDESEADKMLVTYDPLGAMAEANQQHLEQLLDGVETSSDALRALLESLSSHRDEGDDETSDTPTLTPLYQIVIECRDEEDQERAYKLCRDAGYSCKVLTL